MIRFALALCLSSAIACHTPAPGVLESSTAPAALAGDDPTVVAPDALTIPALGAREPLVVVSLFTDYECPNCKRAHDLAARLVDRWPDVVQVQFRQLPLDMHPRAMPTAIAAIAAHRQGQFACMHAALVKSRPEWMGLDGEALRAVFVDQLAPWCGLDVERFARDLDDPAIAAFVEEEREIARDLGVRGTPAVLVDGLDAKPWPRPGVAPALLLNALVRRSLREAEAQLELGVPRAELPAQRVYANLGDADKARLLLGGPR